MNGTNKINAKTTIFWKIAVIVLGLTSLSSGLVKGSEFWSGYVLDICGPAWCYVLIRVQYKNSSSTFLSVKFSPLLALSLITGICFIVEAMQYLEIYQATFDPYDFLAYFSGIFIVFMVDKGLTRMKKSLPDG
jgi:hypothetical protein